MDVNYIIALPLVFFVLLFCRTLSESYRFVIRILGRSLSLGLIVYSIYILLSLDSMIFKILLGVMLWITWFVTGLLTKGTLKNIYIPKIFRSLWATDTYPVIPDTNDINVSQFSLGDRSISHLATHPNDMFHNKRFQVGLEDDLKFNSMSMSSIKKSELMHITYNMIGGDCENPYRFMDIDFIALKGEPGAFHSWANIHSTISNYIFCQYFLPNNPKNEDGADKLHPHNLNHLDFTHSNILLTLKVQRSDRRYDDSDILVFLYVSDEHILLLKFHYLFLNADQECQFREFLNNWLSKLSIDSAIPETILREKESVLSDNAALPESFPHVMPSKYEFERALAKKAKDPISWYVFEHSPNYYGWIFHQYASFRMKYREVRKEYCQEQLKEYRV